jgi:O-antigen/teichoic acid export membrane protein
MQSVAKPSESSEHIVKGDLTRKQLRGSSLLLAGRLLGMGINFATQVLMVRSLSTADYGAWAYALSVVAFWRTFASLGLQRAVPRFVPIYHEQHEYGRLFGTLFLVVGTIILTGVVAIVGIYAVPETISHFLSDARQPLLLLSILVFLVPVEALDELFVGLFASFASPRAIFFRKHILGPGLKLIVVILLVVWQSQVTFLAYGYLIASTFGVLLYSGMLMRLLHRQGLFERFHFQALKVPFKEIMAFTIPVLTTDLVSVVMNSVDVWLLGYFHNTAEVAFFRVVVPAADMNTLVMMSFSLLFTPAAARLFARGDYGGINRLYWQTAVWMAVLTFPIFAMTFSMAQPLTVFLYGARYERSGIIVALLSLGYYFNVALGFNGLTIRVLGKTRYIVIINVLAAVTNLVVNLLLIPPYGALGAAIGTAGTMIVHNIFKQTGLRLASGLSIFDRDYLPFYLFIACSALGLFFIQLFNISSIYIAVLLDGVVSLFVFTMSKKYLHIIETFPEIMNIPLLRFILR